MYCNQCGKKIKDNVSYCEHCGNAIKKTNSIDLKEIKKENNKEYNKATILCIISMIILFSAPSIYFFKSEINYYFPNLINLFYYFLGFIVLTGFILLIIARVKYPNYSLPKILMILYVAILIGLIIALMLIHLFIYITCDKVTDEFGDEIESCSSMGEIISK